MNLDDFTETGDDKRIVIGDDLARAQQAIITAQAATVERLTKALKIVVAAANQREAYNRMPPDKNRIGEDRSPKSRARLTWMGALRKAETVARAALKGGAA